MILAQPEMQLRRTTVAIIGAVAAKRGIHIVERSRHGRAPA